MDSQPARRQTRGGRSGRLALAFAVSAGAAAGLLLALVARDGNGADGAEPRRVAERGPLGSDERATIDLFRESSPSVVYITTVATGRDFFFNATEIPRGTGSGFIWDDSGHVVTNFHVIQSLAEGDRAEVTLQDQSVWRAQVVGVEPNKDLAVLRIDAPRELLKAISIGRSGDLEVGQKVLAIGNPFGLDYTLTTGVISALGREITSVTRRPIEGVIQTDAAINPGNSGGPLLDSSGRLIGITTAIYSPSGAYAGIGFAVPVDIVNRLVPQLIAYGKVVRPGLGIRHAEDQTARRLGIRGVLVLDVIPGTGAAEAGLSPTRRDRSGRVLLGDIIVALDDGPVASTDDLWRFMDSKQVGDTVTVAVKRDASIIKLRVPLRELP